MSWRCLARSTATRSAGDADAGLQCFERAKQPLRFCALRQVPRTKPMQLQSDFYKHIYWTADMTLTLREL
jgi:hypothetical protein